jgi:hypothetical protein
MDMSRDQPYTGDPNGPKLSHLRVKFANKKRDYMLKPGSENLTDNDYFHILIGLTAGDAHDQACALLEELEEELATTNEAAKALHNRQLATSDSTDSRPLRQKKTAGAGASQESAGDGALVVGEFLPETLYHDPINRFWKLMERLYPEGALLY